MLKLAQFQLINHCKLISAFILILLLNSISTNWNSIQAQTFHNHSTCGFDPTVKPPENTNPNPDLARATCDPNIVYIRVAYHFIQEDNGTGNFTKTDDGQGNSNYNGYQRADDIIKYANEKLADNHDPWLKAPGEDYPNPTPTITIRYVLTGVYFHKNSTHINAHHFNYDLHDLYGVDKANTINIYDRFFPDPKVNGGATLRKPRANVTTYNKYLADLAINDPNLGLNQAAWVVNHENGHVLNLYHSWVPNDHCPDTVPNPGCWNYVENDSICGDWAVISNNVMGITSYNRTVPAFTCDQIERMETELSATNYDYAYNVDFDQTNCDVFCDDIDTQPAYAFFVPKVEHRGYSSISYVDMDATASFMEEGYKIEICRTGNHFSNSTTCISSIYDLGWSAGEIEKIRLSDFYTFQTGNSYLITLTVDNNACGVPHSTSRLLHIGHGQTIIDAVVIGNGINREINYELMEEGTVKIVLVDINTGIPVKTVVDNEYRTVGQHSEFTSIESLNSGLYKAIIYCNDEIAHTSFFKF